MGKEYIKTEDGKLKLINTDEISVENVYDYDFLVSQRQRIQDQKDRDNAQRDLELLEVNTLIDKCVELEIGSQIINE